MEEKKRRCILVCGSRSFADSASKMAFALTQLDEALSWLRGDGILVAGGARGADTFAEYVAIKRRIEHMIYLPSGELLLSDGRVKRWSPTAVHPFRRNTGMAEALVRAQAKGFEVRVVGLIDEGSSTQGTAHMLRVATEMKLPVSSVRFPAVG